jgi:hypothetical protein
MALPVVIEPRLRKLAIRGNEAGFGGAKSVLFIRSIKQRQTLACLYRIADIDGALHDTAAYPESESDLNLAFDRARELNRLASLMFIDGYDTDRPERLDGLFFLARACGRQDCHGHGGQPQKASWTFRHGAHPSQRTRR